MGKLTGSDEPLLEAISRQLETKSDPELCHQELWDRYGETVAALILDTSGFSRTSDSHGIVHCLSRLVALRTLCRPVFHRYNCSKLLFEADNIFAIFHHMEDAVAAAMAVNEEVYSSRLMLTEEERFKICIGIGYGRMLYSGPKEGYFSREMNYASKLGEDVAEGDEILLTENAYKQLPVELRSPFTPKEVDISGIHLKYHQRQFKPE